MKDKLIFDTTSAQTIADSDSIGAFLRSSDGTLLTHTDVGGKKALDVRVAEGINLEVDLDAADDSVAAHTFDGAGNAIGSTGGALHISDAGGSLTVDGSVSITGDVNVTQGTSPWVVSATDLDIRDLDAAQDSVQSNVHDGAGNAINSTSNALNVYVTGSGALTVNDAALANTAIANEVETLDVANTSQNIVASVLANRKYLYAYNKDNQVMYIGGSGVTSSNGFPVSPGSYIELRAGAAIDIEFVSAKLNHEIRTLQLS